VSAYLRGVANQVVEGQLTDTGTGGLYAGVVNVYLEKDNGAQVLGTVNGGVATLKGNGSYAYVPTADEFDADKIKFTFVPAVANAAVAAGVTIPTLSAVQQQAIQLATGGQYRAMDAIITAALIKIRVARSGDVPPAEDLQLGLDTVNRIYDAWNADERAIWTLEFTDYTLTPGLSPHTIGPTGTFVVGQRPDEIKYAALSLGGAPAVYVPVRVRDAAWYANQPIPALSDSVPIDLYYAPAFPNGKLYFYGVPSTAYSVRLWSRVVLSSVVLTDTFLMPPGYEQAVLLTLAEMLAEDFGRAVTPTLERQAREARDRIFAQNVVVPRVRPDGMRQSRRGGGSFNYKSRSFN
jgi:hypothetical protein